MNETNDVFLGLASTSTMKTFEKMVRHGNKIDLTFCILDNSEINFKMTFPKGRVVILAVPFQMSSPSINSIGHQKVYRHIINGTQIRFQI